MNKKIHQLERDIQIMERNGFHIYTQVYKSNNVLNSLKKYSFEKYMSLQHELNEVCSLLRKRMDVNYQERKSKHHHRSYLPYFKNKLQ